LVGQALIARGGLRPRSRALGLPSLCCFVEFLLRPLLFFARSLSSSALRFAPVVRKSESVAGYARPPADSTAARPRHLPDTLPLRWPRQPPHLAASAWASAQLAQAPAAIPPRARPI